MLNSGSRELVTHAILQGACDLCSLHAVCLMGRLYYNNVRDPGAEALAEGLKVNTSLTSQEYVFCNCVVKESQHRSGSC